MAKQMLYSLTDLKHEINDFEDRFPMLAQDQRFVLWFLLAFITDNEEEAAAALCGGPKDKGFDAVLVDERTRNVIVVQGKYRQELYGKAENRNDVIEFASLAGKLVSDNQSFADFCKGISPDVLSRITPARKRLLKDGYGLQLYYVTLGRCSKELAKEAGQLAKHMVGGARMGIVVGRQVLRLLSDYLDGVAPPVPSLELEMESGSGIQVNGVYQRFDGQTQIESWVFSMTSRAVAQLYEQAGNRLFARNVRGFLGNTEINRGMETTLQKESQYFWYYNNGITIICDEAEERSSQGRKFLWVANPQIINGQQTTRTLARWAAKTKPASVTVRVIRVPRESENGQDSNQFDTLVSRIVSATNWQNAIRPSDLMSNDRRQIELDRQLRKLGYWYIRKRQSRAEARSVAGALRYFFVTKEALAQAVAGCDLDPAVVREGKENLFEERLYGQVFPNSDPYYYLSRYWLMTSVSYAAKGYPERAYAKWLVLNFVWSHFRRVLSSKSRIAEFKRHWERNGDALYYLWRANDAAYKAALRFYRLKRGKGAKAIDVSTFFQRRNLHTQFEKFWKGPNNPSRTAFNKAIRKLADALEAGE